MAICSEVLKQQGEPYPRTCAVHGLTGCKTPEDRPNRIVRVYATPEIAVLMLPADMNYVNLRRRELEWLISDLQDALEQMGSDP